MLRSSTCLVLFLSTTACALAACSSSGTESAAAGPSDCPRWSEPHPSLCADGVWASGGVDERGCPRTPVCNRESPAVARAALSREGSSDAGQGAVCALAAKYEARDFAAMSHCGMAPDPRDCAAQVGNKHYFGSAISCESPLTDVLVALCADASSVTGVVEISCWGEREPESLVYELDMATGRLSSRSGS